MLQKIKGVTRVLAAKRSIRYVTVIKTIKKIIKIFYILTILVCVLILLRCESLIKEGSLANGGLPALVGGSKTKLVSQMVSVTQYGNTAAHKDWG